MTTPRPLTQHLLTAALAIILTSLAMDAHCKPIDAAKLCAKVGCALPVQVVVDDSRNMPLGVYAHTTVSNGVCILTFTAHTVKRRDVVTHEVFHCLLDADVLGPFGWEGISLEEQERREARVIRRARRH